MTQYATIVTSDSGANIAIKGKPRRVQYVPSALPTSLSQLCINLSWGCMKDKNEVFKGFSTVDDSSLSSSLDGSSPGGAEALSPKEGGKSQQKTRKAGFLLVKRWLCPRDGDLSLSPTDSWHQGGCGLLIAILDYNKYTRPTFSLVTSVPLYLINNNFDFKAYTD